MAFALGSQAAAWQTLLVFATIQPIMFVVLFVYVFGGSITVPGSSYVQFVVPGIFAQTVVFGSAFTGIGVAEDMDIWSENLQLSPGDAVVLYTDGVTEARLPDGSLFGLDGLGAALREAVETTRRVVRPRIEVEIDESDLRVDTYRAGGAGGQQNELVLQVLGLPVDVRPGPPDGFLGHG